MMFLFYLSCLCLVFILGGSYATVIVACVAFLILLPLGGKFGR